jgi:hypothetical protein
MTSWLLNVRQTAASWPCVPATEALKVVGISSQGMRLALRLALAALRAGWRMRIGTLCHETYRSTPTFLRGYRERAAEVVTPVDLFFATKRTNSPMKTALQSVSRRRAGCGYSRFKASVRKRTHGSAVGRRIHSAALYVENTPESARRVSGRRRIATDLATGAAR